MNKIILLMEIICLISATSACSDDPPIAPEGASSDWDNSTKVEGTLVTYTCINGEEVNVVCDAVSLTWKPSTIICPHADLDAKRRQNFRKIKVGNKIKKKKKSGKKGNKRTGGKHGRKSGKKHGGKKTQSPVTTESPMTTKFPVTTESPVTTEVPAVFNQTKPNQTCTCGVKKTPRIVGGQQAQNFEWPWMVRLMVVSSGFSCGGSLIADQWILSAAHCTIDCKDTDPTDCTDKDPTQLIVYLGDHETYATNTNEKLFTVVIIINHKNYRTDVGLGSHNDISLLKLNGKVDLNKYTPVCLPNLGTTYVGEMVNIYGWGATSFGGSVSSILLETRTEVITQKACLNHYGNFQKVLTKGHICAYTVGTDACQGDSGGPMTYDDNGKHKQIGVVSYGRNCARVAGVYTRVTSYLDWINKKIEANGGAVYCNK